MTSGSSGGIGVLGILVGALIIAGGAGVMFATGTIGPNSPAANTQLPLVASSAR